MEILVNTKEIVGLLFSQPFNPLRTHRHTQNFNLFFTLLTLIELMLECLFLFHEARNVLKL